MMLNEQEIVSCLVASGCLGTAKLSYESGTYEITRPTLAAERLVAEIEKLIILKHESNNQ